MLTFHSVMVPVLVIIPIEVAIYLNMTIPYIIGDSMVYIGYIIVAAYSWEPPLITRSL